MVNLLGALIAYTYQEKKPSLSLSVEEIAVLSNWGLGSYDGGGGMGDDRGENV